MKFFRFRKKKEEPKKEQHTEKPEVLKRVPEIGALVNRGDNDVIVTSNQPLLEQGSKQFDALEDEIFPKVTRRRR